MGFLELNQMETLRSVINVALSEWSLSDTAT